MLPASQSEQVQAGMVQLHSPSQRLVFQGDGATGALLFQHYPQAGKAGGCPSTPLSPGEKGVKGRREQLYCHQTDTAMSDSMYLQGGTRN